MKLWIARFVLDTGCNYHQYELIISAPDYSEAKKQVYAFDEQYCGYEDNIDYRTLTIDEIDISKTKILKTFDRGII